MLGYLTSCWYICAISFLPSIFLHYSSSIIGIKLINYFLNYYLPVQLTLPSFFRFIHFLRWRDVANEVVGTYPKFTEYLLDNLIERNKELIPSAIARYAFALWPLHPVYEEYHRKKKEYLASTKKKNKKKKKAEVDRLDSIFLAHAWLTRKEEGFIDHAIDHHQQLACICCGLREDDDHLRAVDDNDYRCVVCDADFEDHDQSEDNNSLMINLILSGMKELFKMTKREPDHISKKKVHSMTFAQAEKRKLFTRSHVPGLR